MSQSMVTVARLSTDPNVSGDQGTLLVVMCERCRSFGIIKRIRGAFKHVDFYVPVGNESRDESETRRTV